MLAGGGRGTRQAQDSGLGVAAGVGNELSRGNFIAIQLGKAIHSLGEVGQIGMTFTVPLSVYVGIAQSIVGTQIDHPQTRLEQLRQRFHANPMRQAGKNKLNSLL